MCRSVLLCVFFAALGGVIASDLRNKITLTDGGYGSVLIAINKDVAEDQNIVDNLIDIFSTGSGHLFTATRRRTFWRNITILIPNTWEPKPEYEPARTESFETANVIVDAQNPEWGDNPYTLQLGGCGTKGEYIHLTPGFLTDRENSEYIWGPMDKLLTHEWAHLRWGVFDEYETDDEGVERFYATSRGNIEATRCTDQIKGRALNINDYGPCKRSDVTGLYEEDCYFFPNLNGQQAPASIMYAQYLDSVTGYCHSEPEVPGYHNVEAPNKHNKLCASQSAWDVMLQTDDFLDGNNPPFEGDIDTTPTFRLVQARERRVVLVLDTSGSMGNNDRLVKLNQAATQYLRYTIDLGSYVGIVHFNEFSYILAELTEIADAASRETLVDELPTEAEGWTCIGCGILDGIEVLRGVNRTDDPAGGYLLLVSDGEQNRQPYIDEVLDQVYSAGVIIDTIAFSEAADPELLALSVWTNGLAFFYPDTANSTALNDAFTATVTSRPGLSTQTLPIQIYSAGLTIPAGGSVTDTFVIDSSIGADTVLIFSWLDDPIDVEVVDPAGNRINSSDSSQYRRDDAAKIIAVKISDTATPGVWSFTITGVSTRDETVLVTIESKQTSTTEDPITVNAVVSSQTIDHSVTPTLEIFAEVRKGYLPVINAVVQAVIESPGSATTYLPLYDNGAGADITKNDGVYSAYFLDFNADGRYSIKVQVSDQGSTTSISSRSRRGSRSNAQSPDRYTPTPATFEPTEPFVRTSSGGVFEVENFVAPVGDQLPPSRIADLAVIAANYELSSVKLQWTAVGDDFDQGTASLYDLRFATTFATLNGNFTFGEQVGDEHLTAGNLSVIAASGTIETVTVTLPDRGENVTYFFGIVAADEAGNSGDLSNLVSASLEYVPPLVTEPMTTSNFVEPDTGMEPWAIGLISGLAAVVVILVIGIIFLLVCAKSTAGKKVDDRPDSSYPTASKEGKVKQVNHEDMYDNSAYLA